MTVNTVDTYPLRDHPGNQHSRLTTRAQWTGEHRPPKRWEWYLSGAIVEAYKARENLTDAYHIARLVKVEQRIGWDVIGPA